MIEYKTIEADVSEDSLPFVALVQAEINNGWELAGGVTVIPVADHRYRGGWRFHYVQAVTKQSFGPYVPMFPKEAEIAAAEPPPSEEPASEETVKKPRGRPKKAA